jgi:hypothetical protein
VVTRGRLLVLGAVCMICAACAPVTGSAATGAPTSLAVAPDGPAAGYSRAQFGAVGWPDGADGCSVRDETLARDLTATTRRGRCDITTGTLADPYSGRTVSGSTRSDEIDHVVPLALAWRSGAARWTAAQRAAFAVDPLELQTTTHAQNDQKGDKGPEAWAPAADPCRYGHAFVAVATKYRLTVSAARQAALARLQSTC